MSLLGETSNAVDDPTPLEGFSSLVDVVDGYRDSRRKPTTSVVRMNPTKPTQSPLDSTA